MATPTSETTDATPSPAAVSVLGDNVTTLERNGATYHIVGTAHVSQESVKEVRRVIEAVQPDTVCVELCDTRYNALTDEDRWRKLDIFKVIKEKKTLFLLANLAVGAYQRRLGAELGVEPGAELIEAVKVGEEVGAEVVLVDRDIQTTLKRTWGNLGFLTKLKLLGAIFESLIVREPDENEDEIDIEDLKEKAHLSEMMAEFSREFPQVHKPLIDERDQYLMSGIEGSEGKTIVAIVGAGHVEGMTAYLGEEVDRTALEEMPVPSKLWGLVKWIIPAIILLAFAHGYQKTEGASLEDMLLAWILPNSIFAAALTALAGAKLLSIVTSFFASPITSLNPLLGAGMVVGLLEAWLRKPTVEDCERINEDVQSWRGVYKNPFTRVLLVAVAATLGSALGAWVGLGWVVTLVAT